MKKQVVVIHGGHSYNPQRDFMEYLRRKDVVAEDFKWKPNWKGWLNDKLGAEYEIFYPQMPNKESSRYEEWKTWFEKLVPFLKSGVILVGHSLGAIFLAKYLSENEFPVSIGGIFLVAPPFSANEFSLSQDLEKLDQAQVTIYHSKDDPVVSFANVEKYKSALPKAEIKVFDDRGHFRQETFPELLEDILSI